MIVFRDRAALELRRTVTRGPLAPLADSLAADLEPWLHRDLSLPLEKARLTRRGGRCEADGTLLAFDPAEPRRHACPQCGGVYDDDAHYRWWIMSFHLWYAERGVHAALLHALHGDERHRRFAVGVLEAYVARYLEYPNRDNVLGPTRPFFSTYLESIWLLQLCAALDLLETAGAADAGLAARVRERVIEPSRALIASYDEGGSNRQVWNAAALAAASLLLGDRDGAERALLGASSVSAQLRHGLLVDGSWYEGENYHQFAQRGLWYGVHLADVAGVALEPGLTARFDTAAALPFLTAFPDLTVPARRDSQWNVSLHQWRFAEMAELGLARTRDDRVLCGALHALYDPALPRGDTMRSRSTAEAERNAPATGLSRADLGWRSLVAARPELPSLEASAARSLLLPAQGLAILRRDEGRTYVALDCGASGGGHGHPDRLNLLLARDAERWLDDAGTGSYTTADLFWYRSALAHNAPFIDQQAPSRAGGALRAWDERGGIGWVDATFEGAAPGVVLRRAIVAMPDYLLDQVEWSAPRDVTIDLPMHADGEARGVLDWEPYIAAPDGEADAGFEWIEEVEATTALAEEPIELRVTPAARETLPPAEAGTPTPAHDAAAVAVAWIAADEASMLWRAVAPGPPGTGARRFHVVRAQGSSGTITTIWSAKPDGVRRVSREGARTTIEFTGGERHVHSRSAPGWRIDLSVGASASAIDLAGLTDSAPAPAPVAVGGAELDAPAPLALPAHFTLGEPHWRATEDSWAAAGAPRATVDVDADAATLRVSVRVHDPDPHFAAWREENELDNEAPDVNSSGVQLHLSIPGAGLGMASWLLVPDDDGSVRFTPGGGAERDLSLAATFHADDEGWVIEASWPRVGPLAGPGFRLDVLVNDISLERERRRGQLVLSGARGERAYLAGDRQSPDRYLPFVFPGFDLPGA